MHKATSESSSRLLRRRHELRASTDSHIWGNIAHLAMSLGTPHTRLATDYSAPVWCTSDVIFGFAQPPA